MKKLIYILILLFFSVFVTGCFSEKDQIAKDKGRLKGIYRVLPSKSVIVDKNQDILVRNIESNYVTVYHRGQSDLQREYSLNDEPGRGIDYIHDGFDHDIPTYQPVFNNNGEISYVEKVYVKDECDEYKEAFGVKWCPEQGYVESVDTKDEDQFVEGYIEKFGPRGHGLEGYIEKFGA